MRNLRLIARLDVKMNWLIKGVQMEGWRKVGDPAEFASRYAAEGADELLFMDVVASLYQRNNLHDIVERVAGSVFVPMTVGGGIRTLQDVKELLDRGADKVALNTAATQDPELLRKISDRYGSQATVLSIEARRSSPTTWEALTDNGRNPTGRDVIEWAQEAEHNGAGEIIITSVPHEGRGKGMDIELIQRVSEAVSVPVVAAGGLGSTDHLADVIDRTRASAVAMAQALHWGKASLAELRVTEREHGCFIRPLAA